MQEKMKPLMLYPKLKILSGLVIYLFLYVNNPVYPQPDISLFDYWEYYSDHQNILYKSLTDIALGQLKEREKVINSLNSQSDWETRRETVREKLKTIIGDFPERTPLHPKITGTLKGDGFRVEKVIYESQSGLYVTAALFIPDRLKGKTPAILYCSGHTFEAFRSETYQHAIINLTKKGFIVLAFDPIGQGERLLYLDQGGTRSRYNTPTHEHSYVGGQCFISGQSLAKYMIWDGIRSIDYLISRDEVDPERIGITGRSGGGTQTVYISAYDDRIAAAAPENYVTSFKYLLTSIGPQDAEQNLPYFLKNNLDFADLLEVRVPKPTLIISTLNDFFSIQGARETFEEVQKAYDAFDAKDKILMTEDIAGHASTLKNREVTYAFFQKHLDNPGDPGDEEVTLFDKEDLMVTPTGQVLTAYQGETIFSLNKKVSEQTIENKSKLKGALIPDRDYLRKRIQILTGHADLTTESEYIYSGTVRSDEFDVHKYLVDAGKSRKIPVIVMAPDAPVNNKAIIILNPKGKAKELDSTLPVFLASRGFHVVLPDVTGCGELADQSEGGDSYISHSSYNKWYAGILTGKNITGLHIEDISSVCDFIIREFKVKDDGLYGIARGVLTSDLLHTGIAGGYFSRLALIEPLISQKSLVLNMEYDPIYIQSSIAGSIAYYDLPDLIAEFCPMKMLLVNITDQSGEHIRDTTGHSDIRTMIEEYKRQDAEKALRIRSWNNEPLEVIFKDWLE